MGVRVYKLPEPQPESSQLSISTIKCGHEIECMNPASVLECGAIACVWHSKTIHINCSLDNCVAFRPHT